MEGSAMMTLVFGIFNPIGWYPDNYQHVDILNGEYVNFNYKCMVKTFNTPNKLISLQFDTIIQPILVIIIIIIIVNVRYWE